MTTLIEAARQALEALERGRPQIVGALVQQDQDIAITDLRQAIEQAEKQEPVAYVARLIEALYENSDPVSVEAAEYLEKHTSPPPRQPLTVAQAHDMGAKGGEPTEAERLLFEAWMRGHCWKVCGTWDGKQYRSPTEVNGEVDYHAMHTRQLWAAWRDRAALEAAHGIKGEV